MPSPPLYEDIMALLSLIRTRQTHFLNNIAPPHLRPSPEIIPSFNIQQSNSHINSLVAKHATQKGELITKFWITLRKIMRIFMEKAKLVNIQSTIILNTYSQIVQKLLKFIQYPTSLTKFIQIQRLLKKKEECRKVRQQFKNKSPSLVKKSMSKITKPYSSVQKKREKNSQQTKFIKKQKNSPQKNKTSKTKFQDFDFEVPLQKYNRLYGNTTNCNAFLNDLYSRNQPIQKSITKFYSQLKNLSNQIDPEAHNFNQSMLEIQKNEKCKSSRRNCSNSKKRPFGNSFQMASGGNDSKLKKSQKQSRHPQSSKMNRTKPNSEPASTNKISVKIKENRPFH